MRKLFQIFILFASLASCHILYAQDDPAVLLRAADSLFDQKKYQESVKLYESLYFGHKRYSPQSLLKMAFIKEAWGEYVEALYYYNQFYENHPDKKVFAKMRELAEKQKLSGYVYSDLEFFSTLYKNYFIEIILALFGLVFLYFLSIITNKIFIKGLSTSSPLFFLIFVGAILWAINVGHVYVNPVRAIVLKDKCLIMEAPSAGSKPITTIDKGHRLAVLGSQDVWCKVKVGDKEGFIRRANLFVD